MRHPVIGITGRRAGAPDDYPETHRHLSSDVYVTAYAEAVARAGGLPVWLSREADPVDLAAALDGLLIAGGQDVDPRLYGAVPTASSTTLDPARDRFEMDLVRTAVALGRPVLGICRGLQLINVAFGGTLTADLAVGAGSRTRSSATRHGTAAIRLNCCPAACSARCSAAPPWSTATTISA